jgi:ABC-type sugar transport system ATPase subunit
MRGMDYRGPGVGGTLRIAPPTLRVVGEFMGPRLEGGVVVALEEASMEAPRCGLTLLYGPTGSGKTTILNILAGLEEPDSGEVYVLGRRLDGPPGV